MTPHNFDFGKLMLSGFASGPKVLVRTSKPCPECEQPLHYTEKGVIHMDPPRKKVKCLKCEYTGFVPADYDESKAIDITENCTIVKGDVKEE